MRWVGHVACVGEKTNSYRTLARKRERKRSFGRLRIRWEDNIKIDL
jgi:hypothetical protein